MGNISFLTGTHVITTRSIDEAIYQLENTSVLFLNSWNQVPKDLGKAARTSGEAMVYLDHIVNEIMRSRDHLKSSSIYEGSLLKNLLDVHKGIALSPVTRIEQANIKAIGPGNGILPNQGSPITMEKLLNKIKHRRHDYANFRVGQNNEHIFIITVDKSNHRPDSIVEFIVHDFCAHCTSISAII
ncbi:hypothetical protein GCM10016272_24460 [Psychrobacter glaciei]|uniref:Uncharacterized protein n=1 Tax=Psychrobacter glaciei TaxID=619771 RepID=A0ABQ3GUS1_9GAMM|nr:hypothetical protein [Psychrobacter glaciei]GHD36896.1 hypothetical protein GCM10016272_24460 [Psychrobacter glaciei]